MDGTAGASDRHGDRRDHALAALQLDVPMFELADDDLEPTPPPRAEVRSATPPEESSPAAAEQVPTIREATPVADLSAEEQAAVIASNSGEVDVVADAAPSTSEVPALPMSPPVVAEPAPTVPAMSLPSQQTVPAVSSFVAPSAPPEMPTPPKKQRSRRGGGIGLFLTLLVLAGLVAAGIVFGRQYLFPDDWEENARPYAESVEKVRGVEFVEPLIVTAEAPAQYEQRAVDELVGTWEQDLPMWRSLGLVSGTVTTASVGDLLGGSEPAIYSTEDGQVYHESTLAGAELDARLTAALAVAALDQDFGWSVRQELRTLDDAALTLASVRQQSAAILAASDFAVPLAATNRSTFTSLPPVLAYEVGAPDVFAEILTPPDPVGDNPLAALDTRGPGPIGNETLELGPEPEVTVGAEVLRPAQAMETSFWYLMLAGYLPGNISYDTTKLISSSSLTVTDEEGVTCSYATFAGATPEQDAIIAAVLDAWAVNASSELGASVTALSAGTQLRSCDPGEGVDVMTRAGVAHELIMWRSAELVATQSVVDRGGIEAEVTATVERMRTSGIGEALIQVPPSLAADELAAEIERAMAPVVEPVATAGAEAGGAEPGGAAVEE